MSDQLHNNYPNRLSRPESAKDLGDYLIDYVENLPDRSSLIPILDAYRVDLGGTEADVLAKYGLRRPELAYLDLDGILYYCIRLHFGRDIFNTKLTIAFPYDRTRYGVNADESAYWRNEMEKTFWDNNLGGVESLKVTDHEHNERPRLSLEDAARMISKIKPVPRREGRLDLGEQG